MGVGLLGTKLILDRRGQKSGRTVVDRARSSLYA
jgi:hypothetical protein